MTLEKNNKKLINAWCMYDWANSVYNLVITSAIFPIYYIGVTRDKDGGDMLRFLGMDVNNSELFSYSISFAYLVIALLSPILSGIADSSGNKKNFLKFFCFLGAASCCGLALFTGRENVGVGLLFSMLASIGFSGSMVFYNAYLPEIATEDQFDKVSARGFAFGYLGGVILLVVNLIMVKSVPPEMSKMMTRLSFVTVGLWWVGFAQITFKRLPNNVYQKKVEGSVFTKGFKEIKKVYGEVKTLVLTKKFLLAFFFYSMGVQTIMLLATSFGSKELKLETSFLILTILVIQFVAIGGAYLFSFISKKKGNIFSIAVSVVLWIVVCLIAYFVKDKYQFLGLAVLVGTMMGAIQSMSRSTYAKFIPQDSTDHASYYSFYDFVEKIGIVIGTFSYGYINGLTGSMRLSSLALGVFFIVGFIFLIRIPSKHLYNIYLKNNPEPVGL